MQIRTKTQIKQTNKQGYKIETKENVKVLASGLYGYILEDRAIFKTASLKKCNSFASWANRETDLGIIVEKALEWQQKETDYNVPIAIFEYGSAYQQRGHFYESVLKER